MTIRSRLLWITVGLVVPLVLLGFYNLWISRQTSRELLNESVKQQAELAATAFEQWIGTQTQSLRTIVTLSEGNQATLRDYLNSLVKTRPHWLDVQVVDADGQIVLSQNVRERPLPLVSIETLRSEVEKERSLVIFTEQISDENLRLISLAMPVSGGKFVVARIDGTSASDIFKRLELPEDHIIAVYDSNRRLLYRSNVSPEQMAVDVGNTPLLAAASGKEAATIEIASPYDQITRVYGLARITTANCIIAVGVPSANLYDASSRQFTRHLAFGLMITGLAVLAAFFLARRITQPMTALTRTARAFGSGDLSARANVSGGGAVRELGDTFNQMADKISEREEKSKELDRLKSEFIGSVSHELRTPLTTIKAFVRVLQSNKISSTEREEYLQTISKECDRQIEFVQNLLDLSRIEAGAFKPVFADIDLSDLMADIVGSQLRAADSRGLNLRFDPGNDEIPRVPTDAGLVRRIVSSIIENAMKYTPDGGTITVSIGKFAQWIGISVDDEGCGIDAADLPHIFERFYRGQPLGLRDAAKDVLLQDAPGIGLGLYLVKSMIDEIHAEIIVKSPANTRGSGTRFTILLPTTTPPRENAQ